MALHSKWSSGDLIFYDGTQTVFTIQDDNEGLLIGEDGEGVDVKFFGDTTGAYILWDEDADALTFAGIDISLGDADYINFGAEPDITMRWTTGGVFEILPAAADTDMYLGSTSKPLDIVNYGNITYRAPASQSASGGTVTLTSTSNRIQFISNGTTDNSLVALPVSTGSNAGDQYIIFQTSTGGGEITVSNGATGSTTVATIAATEGAIMISNGTVWRAIVGPET